MYPISPRVIDQQCTLKIGRIKTQRWAQKETKKGFGNEANFGNDYEGEKQDELLCAKQSRQGTVYLLLPKGL